MSNATGVMSNANSAATDSSNSDADATEAYLHPGMRERASTDETLMSTPTPMTEVWQAKAPAFLGLALFRAMASTVSSSSTELSMSVRKMTRRIDGPVRLF